MKNNRDHRYPVFHVPHVGGEFQPEPFPVYADTGREMNGTMGGGGK